MVRGHFKIAPRLGHDVRASAVFLLLYLVLLVMAISGVILSAIEYEMGPLASIIGYGHGVKHFLKESHEAGFALVLGFVTLHMCALAFHRFVLRAPVGNQMITGMQSVEQKVHHA